MSAVATRRLRRAAWLGFLLALAASMTVLVAAPAAAQTEPPTLPVVVIPGGPPLALSGPFAGSGSNSPGDFACQPGFLAGLSFSSGAFTHPTLGEGVYEFRQRFCISGFSLYYPPGSTFVLNGSERSLSGTLSVATIPPQQAFGFAFQLTASGACKAHFRAEGVQSNLSGVSWDESGTLAQQGSIVCRLTR
jgi:hypothetical protein